MVSVMPDNAIGAAALGELRRRGIDVAGVAVTDGRLELYFLETGSGNRASRVLYDRAHSAPTFMKALITFTGFSETKGNPKM